MNKRHKWLVTSHSKLISPILLCGGGYENAERVFFGAFPDFMDPDVSLFPIRSFTAVFRPCDTLTHRDFLGAFMALGIERSTLGDFLLEEGRCVFFAKEEIGDFILSQITKVGKVGVRLQADFSLPLPAERKFQEFNSVIASPRLDCVVAAATGLSRERARGAITGGLVSLNHEEISNSSKEVKPGDKISFRGKGRFVIDQVGPLTKKGRLLLKGRKYI